MSLTRPEVLPTWAESGDVVQPSNAEIQTGWPLSNTPPSRQRFNWLLNYLMNGVRYLTRRGVPDYSASEAYEVGDRVHASDGNTYRCIQAGTNKSPLTETAYWERWGYSASDLTNILNQQDYKASVRVASTANIETLSGLVVVDGVTLIANDRVLVKDQTTPSQNGIWVAAVGAWARASDADAGAEFNAGAIVPVEEGSTQADTLWQMSTDGNVTIGVTSLNFVQVSGGSVGTPGTYVTVTTDTKGRVIAGATAQAWSTITGTPTTLAGYGITDGNYDPTARGQLAVTNMRLMLTTSVSTGALLQGRQWELSTDEWGATSTNETYTAGTPNYYANPGSTTTNSASGLWSGQTADYSFSGANVGKSSTSQRAVYVTSTVSGDFEFQATLSYTSVSIQEMYFGCFAASEVGTWSNTTNAGNTKAMTNSFMIELSEANIFKGSTDVGDITYASGDTWKFKRVGSQISIYRNGGLVHTFAATFSGDVKLFLQVYETGGAKNQYWNSVSWTVGGTPLNMTLIPPASVSLSSAPTYADAYFLWKDDSGTAVLGTDLTVELSRDGGTTWVTATLTNLTPSAGFDGTYAAIQARASFAGQPTGTSLTCRIKTLNTKAQRVAAPALYAE